MFRSATRYGDSLNSYDILKLCALLAMLIDHAGAFIFHDTLLLRAVGRYAFPAFLFLVGFSGAWKNKADIWFCAILVAVTAAATNHKVLPLNILFAIILTRFVMQKLEAEYDKWTQPMQFFTLYAICAVFFMFAIFAVEYGTMGVLFAFCGLMARRSPGAMTNLYLIAVLLLQAVLQAISFEFSVAEDALMCLLMAVLYWQLSRFTLCDVATPCLPLRLRRVLQWISHNALPVYALHVIILMLVEYYWFPMKLKHFQWL